MYPRGRSVSMSDPAQLCAIPDVLRAVAAVLPPSGLIVLVQSSREIAVVLQDQLTQRFDNLFVVAQSRTLLNYICYGEPLTQPLPHEIEALFGEASARSNYYFVEAPWRHPRDMMGL
jgi:hypothetical protein